MSYTKHQPEAVQVNVNNQYGTVVAPQPQPKLIAVPAEADVYTNLNNEAQQQKPKTVYPNNCSRYIVIFWSLIVLGLGIAALAISGRQRHDIENKIEAPVLRLCKHCHHIVGLLLGAGITCIVGATLGLVSAWRRNKCFSCVFAIIQVLCFLVFISVAVASTILQHGGIDGKYNIDYLFSQAVEHTPDTVCAVQKELNCVGWDNCCYYPKGSSILPAKNISGMTECYLIKSNASAHYAYCQKWSVPSCSHVPEAPVCGPKLRNDIKKYAQVAEAIFYPLAIITFAVTCATKRMTNQE